MFCNFLFSILIYLDLLNKLMSHIMTTSCDRYKLTEYTPIRRKNNSQVSHDSPTNPNIIR